MEKKNQIPKYPHLRFPEFTDEWKEVKLGEVAEIIGGGTPSTTMTNYWNGGIVWFNPSEIGKKKYVSNSNRTISHQGLSNSGARLLPKGTVLLTTRATIGEIAIANVECTTNQGFQSVITGCEANNEYVYYFLSTQKEYLLRHSSGSTFRETPSSVIRNLPLHLPSLPEQQKIAALLSLIDKRIEVQNAIIKEQEVAKTLLSKELLTPEDDWTEYAVQDCLTYEQPAKYIVKHTDYSSDSTLTPVLTANKGFILGYTSEQGIYQKGACIIFDDFTLDCKYVPFAFKVKSSAIKILQARKGFDIRFMFEVIKSLSLSPFAHKRHYISEVEPIKVLVPSFAKQEKIARLFAALDERLAVEKEYATLLQKQKAYLLRQMFV